MEIKSKYKRGFILGKFMPMHTGHMALIEYGKSMVDELTILVCTLEKEPILGDLRFKWVKESFPNLNVVHVTDNVPSYPHEHPDFWDYWMEIFRKYLPMGMEVFICGEEYGIEVASRLSIESEIFLRDGLVSGSKIRLEPFKNWEFIPKIVRPYFIKKIALIGPESTGKTTLASQLSEYFNTNWVPEYGREHFLLKEGKLTLDDISTIAYTQIEQEKEALLHANKLMFCDTDLIVTQIWSEIYFNECPDWIIDYNKTQRYDLYLLMNIDIPWIDDGTREFPNLREYHFNRLKEELERLGYPYKIISGSNNQRLKNAIAALEYVGTP